MRLRLFAAAVGLSLLLPFSLTRAAPEDATIAAAVASPDRPAGDVARDALRKPAALLAFAGIKAGDRVADLIPGQGYFTRLFSNVVGATGHVYAIVPSELAQALPKAVDTAKALAAEPAFSNVSVLVLPTASLKAPEPLDVAWTSDNYHDLYAFFGPDQAQAFDKAVYAALKPGGVFIVIDHVGSPGLPPGVPANLDLTLWMKHMHRIDPAIVKAQVLAAGFRLEAESTILANPADTHTQPIFIPVIRGKTDQFVFRFRKPG
jgi:predicted methyltransferase